MRYGLAICLLMCNEWICHSSLAIWLFTVLVDRRQYEAVMIRNRKYKIQTDVSNFNPSGTWPKPEVTNSVTFLSGTFLLILQFWAFQHQWNVNLPNSLVVCWFTTIGRSMLHWKLNEGSLAAGFLPMLCNVLLEWGPGWDVQYFPKVSDSIMWRLEVKVQYNNLLHWFTDSQIETTSKSKQSFSEMCLRSMKWNNGVCPFCVLHFLVNFYFHIFPKIGSE